MRTFPARCFPLAKTDYLPCIASTRLHRSGYLLLYINMEFLDTYYLVIIETIQLSLNYSHFRYNL